MNQYSITLLVCLGVVMVLAALLYAASRGYLAALTGIGELRATLSQILADTDKAPRKQRPILYDIHKRISAVTKGMKKQPS